MKQPENSGFLWYTYKGFLSLVLLATCDAPYRFSFTEVFEYRSNNNSKIFLSSKMRHLFRTKICGSDYGFPYFLVGYEIFHLVDWLMQPYAANSFVPVVYTKHFWNSRSKAANFIEANLYHTKKSRKIKFSLRCLHN